MCEVLCNITKLVSTVSGLVIIVAICDDHFCFCNRVMLFQSGKLRVSRDTNSGLLWRIRHFGKSTTVLSSVEENVDIVHFQGWLTLSVYV